MPSGLTSRTDCQVVKSASSRAPKWLSRAATCTTRAAGPRGIHALDHPYAGLVLQVVDTESPRQRAELVPQPLRQVPAAQPLQQRSTSRTSAPRSGGWSWSPRSSRPSPAPTPASASCAEPAQRSSSGHGVPRGQPYGAASR
ncbi:hypothetical protein AMK31_17520 [Streptomyces sp. TSRI0107]|nr:hypothetical protein AMK31_17520 [Streptomyces sp. TSRI0107]